VVLSHRVNHLRSHPGALLERRGAMVCPYPLFHMGAWTIALQQWQARAPVVFPQSSSAAAICAAVAEHGATRLNAVPALWRRILEHLDDPGVPDDLLASLRFADTGTSATPVSLLRSIAASASNARVRVFYGSTESGSVAALDQDDIETRPGSCGLPTPSTEVRIGPQGELMVRGPLVFDGYEGDPAATAEAFDGDWFHTGDLADVDADGYLSIVGRTREIIRTGGETVAPLEVEAMLVDHPDVADAAVVGLADPEWGEIVCAVVVPSEPGAAARLDVAAVRAHCEERLARHKHPRRVEVVDAIPRTAATGQIQRRLLAESIATEASLS
jgi:acyl-CoA synthetase (AMP-forming)/AMP-acid ligase II